MTETILNRLKAFYNPESKEFRTHVLTTGVLIATFGLISPKFGGELIFIGAVAIMLVVMEPKKPKINNRFNETRFNPVN
jgi:hypothetical protein